MTLEITRRKVILKGSLQSRFLDTWACSRFPESPNKFMSLGYLNTSYCPVTTLPFVSLSSMWENEAKVWECQSSSEDLKILPFHRTPLHMSSLIISWLLIFKLFIQSFSNGMRNCFPENQFICYNMLTHS